MISYKTQGTCSKQIDIDLKDGIINDVVFYGGCNGNLKAISKIIKGMKAEDVIKTFEGNTCGARKTSCADQLAKGLKVALNQNNK